jgi:hypothetical protein
MRVYALDHSPAVMLAAEELARCLSKMAGAPVEPEPTDRFDGQSAIYVGTSEQFDGILPLPPVQDPNWDDAWAIKSVGPSLAIAGVNPRSALIGAYEYLRMLGAEWVWPGEDGEDLPRVEEIPLGGFQVVSIAANRHRGVCIEGAPALEHVLDMVEWLPRVGMNAYFLQFQVSSHFWRCWYEHTLNPRWEKRTELTESECADLEAKVVAAVKQRSLLLHRVGHGWTAAALGLPANGWLPYDGEVSEETRMLTAEVAGSRGLWHNIPLNTELCYGNPQVRQKVVEVVLRYAADHPDVDVLHFWLSDAVNNHCECSACCGLSPSDWYVTLLNEMSPQLKDVAPRMKLAFLAYLDTLWPPRRVKLDLRSDNLVYMFAPISRCYGHRLADPLCANDHSLGEPRLNEVVMPQGNRHNLELLGLWNSVRPADSFAFDYHFMAIWLQDYLSVRLAELVPQDLADYREKGINGIINCCTQRAFYPNGWPYYVMARTLWGTAPGAELKARYFAHAYGENASAAGDFLDRLACLSGSPVHRLSWWDTADAGKVSAVLEFLREREPVLAAAFQGARTPAQKRSWRLLLHYRQLLVVLWNALSEKLSGDVDGARAQLRRAEEFLRETEGDTASALDTFLMLQHLSRLME